MKLTSSSSIVFLVISLIFSLRIQAQSDECANALQLTNLTNYCSTAGLYSNSTATPGTLGMSSCWTSGNYDVWFVFKAIGTDVQLSVAGGNQGTIINPNVSLYSGTCGGTLNEEACSQGKSDVTSLYKGALAIGKSYYIRVSTTAGNRGTFRLCISNYTPTVNPGADCDGAVKLCDKTDVKVAGLSGGGKNNQEIEINSCFRNPETPTTQPLESNSSWYKWTCDQAGTLTFDIIPNDPTNDLDFILYELNGTSTDPCGTRTIIRCTATGCPVTNGAIGLNTTSTDVSEPMTITNRPNQCTSTDIDGYLKYVDMIAGKTYVLMVNNFSSAAGFTIKFGGTGTFFGPKAVITATTATQACKGESVTYDGKLSVRYHKLNWFFMPGIPSSATSVGPHTVVYNTPGIYTAYLIAIDSTCASGNAVDSMKITIHQPPVIDATNPTITSTNCNDSTGSIVDIKVNGASPFQYEWYKFPSTKVQTSNSTSDLLNVNFGSYYLIVTDSNKCSDTVGNFEIKIHEPPVLNADNSQYQL